MATVWRTRDRLGRAVVVTEADWQHIVAQRAPAVPSLGDIRAAVETPDVVNADARYPRRENHCRRAGAAGSYLKVVVAYRPVPPQGTWAGRVVTAYHTGTFPQKEQNLWP